jgi:hypothetical protein
MLKTLGLAALALIGAAAALAALLHATDTARADRARATLLAGRDPAPPRYDPAMVAGLPEVAQRYFARAIAPGTPLHRIVRLEMEGTFVLNGKSLPMRARQILAPPATGFVWQAQIGAGLMSFAGSDGALATGATPESWTKFWLRGLIPLARTGGTIDHARAAATRVMLESIWAPATLLPQSGARWVRTGPDTAEITFDATPDLPPMQLRLNAAGDPVEVWALRWSDANPDKVYRLQPFGGRMLETAAFGGFRIPVKVELGNFWGTPDYAPFFLATVTAADY